ncbi:hypothetical protein V7095_06825 [Bacillus thuringiensis]|uniref:hypothetical protein n=1 Tax=Bacillus thuringiensis TaxID=1428 RepID=UPI002FFFFBA1
MFFKRKKKKEQNKKVKQDSVKRNNDCTTNDMWPRHTITSNAAYGSYDSDSHSSSCASHSSYDAGGSFDSSSSCD